MPAVESSPVLEIRSTLYLGDSMLGSMTMNPGRCASLFFSWIIARRPGTSSSDAWSSAPSLRANPLIGFPGRACPYYLTGSTMSDSMTDRERT